MIKKVVMELPKILILVVGITCKVSSIKINYYRLSSCWKKMLASVFSHQISQKNQSVL